MDPAKIFDGARITTSLHSLQTTKDLNHTINLEKHRDARAELASYGKNMDD